MDVNVVAVVAAAVASMGIGTIWYMALGKQWVKSLGWSGKEMEGKKAGMGKAYAQGLVVALITAYVLAHFVAYLGAKTWVDGALVGAWAWLGFQATATAAGVIWEKKSSKWWLITNGNGLLSLAVMGAILAML